MTEHLVIGYADDRDVPGVQRVAAEGWRATYRDIYPGDKITAFLATSYSTEGLRRSVRNPRAVFLVARGDDRVVGFCHFGDARGPELFRMYVLPEYWRQGLGARFVSRMESVWRARGVTEYFCHVHAKNEIGKAFYLKHGFVHVPDRDHEDEWCMVKRIGPAA